MLATSPQNAPSPFEGLPANHFKAILVDPPWFFQSWNNSEHGRWNGGRKVFTPAKAPEYPTMTLQDIAALPVAHLAARDCALFCWGIWAMLPQALEVIRWWGFNYKGCAFCWTKAELSQMKLFNDDPESGQWGLGFWTRQNSEFCLLATRGHPKRMGRNIQQGIIEPRREHSRKPDCVYDRIERLVDGPYVELFARQSTRPGWLFWGQESTKFNQPSGVAL